MIHRTAALGYRSTLDWDPEAETATFTDARGEVHKAVYKDGVLEKDIDADGNVTAFAVSNDITVTEIEDPRGDTWTMTYDAAGNLLT